VYSCLDLVVLRSHAVNQQEVQQRVSQTCDELRQLAGLDTPFIHYDPAREQFLMTVPGGQAQHWKQLLWHIKHLGDKGQ
jgi:hypothetical protein